MRHKYLIGLVAVLLLAAYGFAQVGVASPIVAALDNGGEFGVDAFVGLDDPVTWDFFGTGDLTTMSWTNPKRQIAFLATFDKHGWIPNSKFLFGNLRNQPLSDEEKLEVYADAIQAKTAGHKPTVFKTNGFRALRSAWALAKGGYADRTIVNSDGTLTVEKDLNGIYMEKHHITPDDAIWADLRWCVDTVHNAHLGANQCKTLNELGFDWISVDYEPCTIVMDKYGNRCGFQGTASRFGKVIRIVDEYFVVKGK